MRLAKFLVAGILTALLDNGIFFVLHRATGHRFLSLALATSVSVTFNYLVVRFFIFDVNVSHAAALPKYLGVHGVGLVARWGMLEALIALLHLPPKHWGIYAAKLAADGVVYSLKYVVQRDLVFEATHNAVPESDQCGLPVARESIPPATPRQSELPR